MKWLNYLGLNLKKLFFTIDIDTLFMLLAIFLVLGMSLAIMFKKNRYTWQKGAPSLITTTGIFCTFLGVTIGLIRFNPDNSDSLRFLLEGLKLAFIPSALAILISIGFKWVHTKNSATNLSSTFIEKIEENTAAVNKLVAAVEVIDWQIAYKQSLEINIENNAELLAILQHNLTKLVDTVKSKPQELIDSSTAFEQAISETSAMVNQAGQDLKNILMSLGLNIKKAVSNLEQQTKSTSSNPIGNIHNGLSDVNQMLQQLQPLSQAISDELKAALRAHVHELEVYISSELKKAVLAMQE